MIRIIYILNSTDLYGGATKAFLSLSDRIHAFGVEAGVIVPDKQGVYNLLKEKGIAVYQLNYRACVYPPVSSWRDILLFLPRLAGRIILNKKAAKQVATIAADFHADIIHTNTSINDIGYYAAKQLCLPHVWHIREYADLAFHYYYYYNRSQFLQKLKQPNSYTICITKHIQQYNGLATWPKSRVIYDGVLSQTMALTEPVKDKYLLFAGRLEENKGIGDLLKAYAVYTTQCSSPLPLLIAGETSILPYKTELYTLVQDLKIDRFVTFLGMRSDILELMQHALALIVPSRIEGFGFITAEAMFMGTLVIGKNTCGTKEQFDNGLSYTGQEIGLRYQTDKELTERLIEVTKQSTGYYSSYIQRAQETVCALYSCETHTEAVFNLYQDIIQHKV